MGRRLTDGAVLDAGGDMELLAIILLLDIRLRGKGLSMLAFLQLLKC